MQSATRLRFSCGATTALPRIRLYMSRWREHIDLGGRENVRPDLLAATAAADLAHDSRVPTDKESFRRGLPIASERPACRVKGFRVASLPLRKAQRANSRLSLARSF